MKRILYIYTRGRKSKIDNCEQQNAPAEFLYGYGYFKKKDYHVDYIEIDSLQHKTFSLRYLMLLIIDFLYRKIVNLSYSAFYFNRSLEKLNSYDYLIATTDAIALGLSYFKKKGLLKPPVIYMQMGLSDRLYQLEKKNTFLYNIVRKKMAKAITYCSKIICLGLGEYNYFLERFSLLENILYFIPFGIDIQFWDVKDESLSDESYILFVGNDRNRDYSFLEKIPQKIPHRNFRYITRRISSKKLSPNVTLNSGSFASSGISDKELRDIYRKSKMVIVPLGDTIQPSGQSVALQAMACGKPVIISNTGGFWDPANYENNKNILFAETNEPGEWETKIEELFNNDDFYQKVSSESRKLVVEKYSIQGFNAQLEKIINDI